MKKSPLGYVLELPPVASHCSECGRPLDGTMSGPYFPWAVPVLTARGQTCSYCDNARTCDVHALNLPPASREALGRYLAINGGN